MRLCKALHRFEHTRVVISYYDGERLEKMYPEWSRHEITVSKAMANQGSRGSKNITAKEVLLVNEQFSGRMGLFEKGE